MANKSPDVMLTIPTNINIRGTNSKEYNIGDVVRIIEDVFKSTEFDYTHDYFAVFIPRILTVQEFHDIRSLYRQRSWRDVQPVMTLVTPFLWAQGMELRFYY